MPGAPLTAAPLILLSGDCTGSAYIFAPRNMPPANNNNNNNNNPAATATATTTDGAAAATIVEGDTSQPPGPSSSPGSSVPPYEMVFEIQCGATVGSAAVAAALDGSVSREQEEHDNHNNDNNTHTHLLNINTLTCTSTLHTHSSSYSTPSQCEHTLSSPHSLVIRATWTFSSRATNSTKYTSSNWPTKIRTTTGCMTATKRKTKTKMVLILEQIAKDG